MTSIAGSDTTLQEAPIKKKNITPYDCCNTHNEQTTNGKAFVLFIALVIRTDIMGKLKKHLADKSTSLKKLFNQLTNSTLITTSGTVRFTKALTKEQKSILSVFNATDDILASVETCLRSFDAEFR